ncbi:MAG TPA: aminotransferase class V-fold PLP-dependent enzyme, partial [Candidatus Saccharimonas sp.]|nr:aminotransferase class V-fold PLP-dependent enzyme [Candidatus Saccharimonas sp.]
MTQPLYFDYAAATPVDPRVFAVMGPFFSDDFYNPSSSYLAAKQVRQQLEEARAKVAHWLGAKPAEVIFTAGATESINLAVHGVLRATPGSVVTLATEHDAVLA